MFFNQEQFIKSYITHRSESLFKEDIENNRDKLFSEINKKSVLVIGGAGTIGSSFIKSILQFKPGKLIVVDVSENELAELTRDLRSAYDQYIPEIYLPYPISYNSPVFNKIMKNYEPFDIIANFAAHKHVRSEKDIFSIEAMVYNNVVDAKALLESVKSKPPKHYFSVSTDKAANPVNIMGASKKLMEEMLMAYSRLIPITTARFANVAFSNASLLSGFIQRVSKHQPLSCPSDVKRFFVSPEESGQFCMLACLLGESGDIFFPKLKKEKLVNFKDIALDFINYIGYKPEVCSSEDEAREKAYFYFQDPKNEKYPIYLFKTETSGEKLFEEFYTSEEVLDINKYLEIGIIKNNSELSPEDLTDFILNLDQLMNNNQTNKQGIVNLLQKFIPGFLHIETGKNLDQKM